MQKFAKKLSILMVALFTVFTVLSYIPAKAAVVAPKVGYVVKPQLEYTAGDRVQFNLNAPNYGGRVQYRVVLWQDETKSYRDLWTTGDRYYTNWMPYGNETFTLGWPIFEPGHYRITIYAKRAGLANNLTALKGMNCDSFMNSEPFVVTAKEQAATAADKVASYEKAALGTVEEIAAAEALRAEAVALIAKLTDATEKAALTARVEAQDKKVAEAKYVHVSGVNAIDANTIKVTFNKQVAAKNTNFKVYEKGSTYNTILVNSVSVDKETVTVTTYDNLQVDKTYVVEASGVTSSDTKFAMKEMESKEFTFKKAVPVSIAFSSAKVKVGEKLGYVIKDVVGNDITANFTTGTDVIVETASSDVINTQLTALKAGYSLVNVYINDTTVKTGNTVVEAYELAGAKLARLGVFSLGDISYTNPTTSLYLGNPSVKMNVELIDQYNNAFAGVVSYNYISNNPTIAIVNAADGMVTPLSAGSTYITVVATQKSADGQTVVAQMSKTYLVTVKEAPKAASLKLDKSYVKVVKGSNINEKIHVTVLDQYGNVFKNTNNVTLTADKSNIATFNVSTTIVDGESDVVLIPGTTNGTAVVLVEYTGLAKVSFVIENVNPGTFGGYLATSANTTLDLISQADPNYSTLKKGPAFTGVEVFEKDTNGTKIDALTVGEFTLESAQTDSTKRILDLSVLGQVSAVSGKTGTEAVAVKINNITVATFTYTVVDSTPALSNVVQLKTTLGVQTGDMNTALFGQYDYSNDKYTTKGVFVGYDQYGNEVPVTPTSIISTDSTVVNSSGYALAAGKVTLVVKIQEKLYQLEVVVQ